MGRPKKAKTPPEQTDLEQAIKDKIKSDLDTLIASTPSALIGEYHTLNDHAAAESKRFQEYLKPAVERIELIRQALHAKALAQKVNGFPTDEGTAYLSTIVSHKIDPDSTYKDASGRDALLDWMLDNWDKYGSEGLMLNVSKAVVDAYMQENDGKPPPGLKLESMQRVNIKRS